VAKGKERKRLIRCLAKAVKHTEVAMEALAEVWKASADRDKMLAAHPPQGYIPEIDDNRKPEPPYTEMIGKCLEMMDRMVQVVCRVSELMMGLDHDALLRWNE
jgi:hypothetical protein